MMIMRRWIGVMFYIGRLVQDRHVVVEGHENVFGHDRVQEAVQVDEEGDHLPGQVKTNLKIFAINIIHSGVIEDKVNGLS